jgi:putative Mg2+ transporter-C (MgtC) family protein
MTPYEIVIRLGTAVVLGALIGLERQWRQRMAGLRTNALVSTGAACFLVFAALMPGDDSRARVAAQVVSGIGFLGAGVILREGLNVRGLNTAATLWCSAAVGTLAGGGLLWQAALASGVVVLANVLLRPVVRLINTQPLSAADVEVSYTVRVVCPGQEEARVRALLLQGTNSGGLGLRRLESTNIDGTDNVEVSASLFAANRNDAVLEQVIGRLSLEPKVSAVKWQVASETE